MSTTIDNAATNQPISGNQPVGTSVYDTATVSTTPFTFPLPTGTVTYEFFDNGTGSGLPASTDTVNLANGLVPKSTTQGPLAVGSYSYVAIYSGDTSYTGSTGPVEPLTIIPRHAADEDSTATTGFWHNKAARA